jgi:hypothetical protein
MEKITEEKILTDFSYMFREKDSEATSKWPIAWGIECNSGWYPLIYQLCKDIQTHLDKNPQLKETFAVHQVKEKFGGLRFYVSEYDDTISKLINIAESESEKTCEICGKPGIIVTINGRLLKCVCPDCLKAINDK